MPDHPAYDPFLSDSSSSHCRAWNDKCSDTCQSTQDKTCSDIDQNSLTVVQNMLDQSENCAFNTKTVQKMSVILCPALDHK